MNADLFGTDAEAREKRQIDAAKQVALSCLAKARTAYVRAKNSPGGFTAGQAVTYLNVFKELGKALDMTFLKNPVVAQFELELLHLIPEPGQGPPKEVVVRHVRDPEGVKLERDRLEARKIDVSRPKDDLTFEILGEDFNELVTALVGLKFQRQEAVRRARKVYQAGRKMDDMIGEACRI